MDDRITETALSLTKFGVGQPVRRSEDPTLVRGQGRYTDDVSRPNQAYAVMVRSRDAHGVIRSIDTAGAKAMPGVLAVYTAADLTGYGPLKCGLPSKNRDGSPIRYTPRPALTGDKVRFVGDPVACVIAETVAQAKDAAEAVTLDIEPLPAALKPSEAVKPGAPLVFDEVPNNIALDYHYGDAAKVAEAFAKAKHVTRLETSNERMVVNAMEPRSAIGEYDAAAAKWTLYSTSQGVHGMKTSLMEILGAPADKVRVITGQVGGSFGMKAAVYPEYVCLLHGARLLGRPVKWTDERSGSFVSDHHGRAQDMVVEMAFDDDAHILAVRLTGYGDMGGYLAQFGPLLSTGNQVKNIASVYRTPLIEVATKCVFTNTTFVSAYRGAGRPEGNYYCRAHARSRCGRARYRPTRLAQAQHDPQERPALQSRIRHDLRLRRFPRCAQSRLSMPPTTPVSRNASAIARSAACCADSASAVTLRLRPRRQGTRRHSFRSRRHGDDRHRHARLRDGSRRPTRSLTDLLGGSV